MSKVIDALYLCVGFLLLLTGTVFSNTLSAQPLVKCQLTTPQLDTMQQQNVLLSQDGSATEHKLNVKIASNNAQRHAGFQHICEQTISKQAILFIFPVKIKPRFHMHNVHVPLDIAFINTNGKIINIQTMYPYTPLTSKKPLYGINKNIKAALEVHQGFFKEHGITIGWKLNELSQLIKESKNE